MSNKTTKFHDIHGHITEVKAKQITFRPSAYGVLIEDGKVLLSKQWDGYDFPGGGVDIDETMVQTVEREFYEETGLRVEAIMPIYAETSFFDPSHSDKYKGQYWNCTMVYFLVKRIGGEIDISRFTEDEQKYAGMPEWINLAEVGNIKFMNSCDNKKIFENVSLLGNNRTI